MLEMQEDKSIEKSDPQSQEINTAWETKKRVRTKTPN